MAYIIKTDLATYAPSVTLSDTVFTELAERASDVIDMVTLYRIPRAGGLSVYAAETQAAIKKATCAQVQTMASQGGIMTVEGWGADVNASSVSVGRFSAGGSGQKLETVNGIPLSPLVRPYLMRTGLTYRGLYNG